jgi:hypothetical protein
MGVSFGRSRVADLAFQVYNRPLHPEWYSTRGFRRIEFPGWRADVRIIEGGHVVIFSSSGVFLSEVLSGPETQLPESGVMFHSRLRHERSAALKPDGSVEYHACFEADHVDMEVFRQLCEEAICDSRGDRLFYRFQPTNRLAPPPITQIVIDANTRSLSIHSFHSFPDESAIVRTQSRYDIKRSNPKT